jgi:hypothetical protein
VCRNKITYLTEFQKSQTVAVLVLSIHVLSFPKLLCCSNILNHSPNNPLLWNGGGKLEEFLKVRALRQSHNVFFRKFVTFWEKVKFFLKFGLFMWIKNSYLILSNTSFQMETLARYIFLGLFIFFDKITYIPLKGSLYLKSRSNYCAF